MNNKQELKEVVSDLENNLEDLKSLLSRTEKSKVKVLRNVKNLPNFNVSEQKMTGKDYFLTEFSNNVDRYRNEYSLLQAFVDEDNLVTLGTVTDGVDDVKKTLTNYTTFYVDEIPDLVAILQKLYDDKF